MGKHTIEHNLILDKLSQCEANADVVFRKWHNSDAKVNDIVNSNRDDIKEAKQMLAAHIRATADVDDKIEKYDRYSKWVILLGGAFVASMGRHLYQMIM